jgi:hypothetical protein
MQTEMPLAPGPGAPRNVASEDFSVDEAASDLTASAPRAPFYRFALSALVAVGPIVTAGFVAVRMLGRPVPWLDLLLASIFYLVILHGVTVGFHRLFTHKSFDAARPLKVSLALLITVVITVTPTVPVTRTRRCGGAPSRSPGGGGSGTRTAGGSTRASRLRARCTRPISSPIRISC